MADDMNVPLRVAAGGQRDGRVLDARLARRDGARDEVVIVDAGEQELAFDARPSLILAAAMRSTLPSR